MQRPHLPLVVLLLASVLLTAGSGLAQTRTPAGTEITNQAVATFDPPRPGDPTRVLSNVVRTAVQAVCAASLTPDGTLSVPGQQATVLPGERAVFRYAVVNAGNGTFTLPLTARSEEGSAFTPRLRVVMDADGDGVPGANEPTVESVTLPADGRADLLLVVEPGDAAQGDTWVNLIAGCAGGEQDANNLSRVRVGPPPVLTMQKSFTPARVRPGMETTVTVTARNGGQGESREVVLTDPLADQLAQGLVFVPGSAQASAGVTEYTSDGVTWGTAEPAQVRGVRLRAASLAPGADLTLTFRLRATGAAENRVIPNTATATTGTWSAEARATADVRYLPAVAIGPVGAPEAPENTPADMQTRAFAVVGQPVCFDHTLKNTGDVRDTFTVSVASLQAQASLYGENGLPLVQPLPLDSGGAALVRVCYAATQAGSLAARVTASGARGTSNTTQDLVQGVEAGLPELVKSVAPAPTQTVAQGDLLTYTLRVRNPYTHPLTGVTVRDPLPAHLEIVSASDGGEVSGQGVTWDVGTLAPGETRTFTVTAKVSERAIDGEALKNSFSLSSTELPAPILSNEVASPVWGAALQVSKAVNSAQAAPGDRLTYTLRIRNLSPTTAIEDAAIIDTPARGLSYLAGTSTLAGKPLADPGVTSGVLRWNIGSIPAGGTLEVTYQTRVTPEASGDLVNRVEVVGTGAGGLARAISSDVATATTRLNPGNFAPLGDLLGTVFVDRNRNGLFDAGLDTPVERARLLLAGGRLALTDTAGRYHFANVPFGTQALRLDPNSAPYLPLNVPQAGGLMGTQTVQVRGLTRVDFPLAPLAGDITATRRTVLISRGVRIEKTVQASVQGGAQGYVVTLRLTVPAALSGSLPDFDLQDPLPAGATLKEGRTTLAGRLAAGETLLSYRFEFAGGPEAAVTDPALRWRN